MLIIVGLGNPGEKFKDNRHNLGFMAVDFFARKNNFPDFKPSKKHGAVVTKSNKIVLVKPQMFMNNSGKTVKKIAAQNKKMEIVIIHDDIDLPLGTFKIVKNRGSAGHKGVESIIKSVGNKNIIRFRLGIQPKNGKSKNSESFVVKNFTREEQVTVDITIQKTTDALDFFIENGLEKTMNKYNK